MGVGGTNGSYVKDGSVCDVQPNKLKYTVEQIWDNNRLKLSNTMVNAELTTMTDLKNT